MREQDVPFASKLYFIGESHQFNCSAGNWQNRSNDRWGAFLWVDNDLSAAGGMMSPYLAKGVAGWLQQHCMGGCSTQHAPSTEAINAHCTCGKYLFQTNSSLIILG
jgi:hypothetical protein